MKKSEHASCADQERHGYGNVVKYVYDRNFVPRYSGNYSTTDIRGRNERNE